MRAGITGNMTFESVDLQRRDDGLIELRGFYYGDVTVIKATPSHVRIGGLVPELSESLTLTPVDDDGWVWVQVTDDDYLLVTDEKPAD